MIRLRVLVLFGLMFGAMAAPAAAQGSREPTCYDVIGCPTRDVIRSRDIADWSCQLLWEVRNQIYFENFYCFKTSAGINAFGNEGCRYRNDADVPFSRVERQNIATIRAMERAKGCR